MAKLRAADFCDNLSAGGHCKDLTALSLKFDSTDLRCRRRWCASPADPGACMKQQRAKAKSSLQAGLSSSALSVGGGRMAGLCRRTLQGAPVQHSWSWQFQRAARRNLYGQ